MKLFIRMGALALLSIFLAACTSPAGSASDAVLSECPNRLDGFKDGVATATQIKACLKHTPDYVNHNPDGRFVYNYAVKNGIFVVYLFDKNEVLIRTRVYQDKNRT